MKNKIIAVFICFLSASSFGGVLENYAGMEAQIKRLKQNGAPADAVAALKPNASSAKAEESGGLADNVYNLNIYVSNQEKDNFLDMGKCHMFRINRDWFITDKHCLPEEGIKYVEITPASQYLKSDFGEKGDVYVSAVSPKPVLNFFDSYDVAKKQSMTGIIIKADIFHYLPGNAGNPLADAALVHLSKDDYRAGLSKARNPDLYKMFSDMYFDAPVRHFKFLTETDLTDGANNPVSLSVKVKGKADIACRLPVKVGSMYVVGDTVFSCSYKETKAMCMVFEGECESGWSGSPVYSGDTLVSLISLIGPKGADGKRDIVTPTFMEPIFSEFLKSHMPQKDFEKLEFTHTLK